MNVITSNQRAELSLLAVALQSPAARKEAKRFVSRDDFYTPVNMTIWDVMCDLDREKIPVEPSVVALRLQADQRAQATLLDLALDASAIPDNVEHYAGSVRSWAVRRRLVTAAIRAQQQAENPEVDATGLASAIAAQFGQIRDSGTLDDLHSITLGELLEEADDEPDWVIPGLLEHRDRFILTGAEGLGKSYLLRQIAIMGAAGLHPFSLAPIPPVKVLIVDCENSRGQVRRKARAVVEFAESRQHARGNPHMVNLLTPGRIDLLRDKDLSAIHREIDVIRPDIIVIGPIYAMSPKALMTDDDAVPVLAALDTMRETGAALLMEAHAGHAQGPDGRNFRPRGSASLMGWPEFGYGLKPVASGYTELVPWRGDRDARDWPSDLRRDPHNIRWVIHDGRGYSPPTSEPYDPTRGLTD